VNQLGRSVTIGLDLIGVDAVQETADRIWTIGVAVGQRSAVVLGIPAFAGNDAGMTANAGVQIDDKAETTLGEDGKVGHLRGSALHRTGLGVCASSVMVPPFS